MSDLNHPAPTLPAPGRLRLAGLIALIVIVVVVALGVISRLSQARELKAWTNEQATPTVNAIMPDASTGSMPLELPGRIEAYTQAPIYARVGGYLKSWKADIGTHVKAGQLLAEIDTPDLDQQLLQARADLASAKANEALAATTAKRWQAMLDSDSVSKQDVDQRTGDYDAKRALANAAQANVDRIEAMKGYARIVAPFDGVVTARNTDVGALINAGSSSGQALFVVSDVSKLRVYVQVPQNFAPSVVHGVSATLGVPEYPGHTFAARFDASAQAVNASSGSTLVQLAVDNADGKLMPGSFASVRFKFGGDRQSLRIPASALIFDASGLHVATVGAGDRVAFKQITILRDYGKTVEIGSGLTAQDKVIDSPPDGLNDGDAVKIADNKPDNGPENQPKAANDHAKA
ncbi:efflux RND transporter periplasmic adaptor subunit [Rhodanobacter sp. C01]|uniref:efflux RND transporter periplasmic adaptor subunit n=1 Tax=Rhodanobacter sp. C01 TaxID=1945856 RepID=UPI0009844C8A|nr:efflux RND transporter periplasmic adaptor subunit [Rhodanobacter sp. C01]OOG51358.1 efflux transporter periplasmic adaptor subunit [Rhodanobacter sp. C01]